MGKSLPDITESSIKESKYPDRTLVDCLLPNSYETAQAHRKKNPRLRSPVC